MSGAQVNNLIPLVHIADAAWPWPIRGLLPDDRPDLSRHSAAPVCDPHVPG
jgi:hypothetical protein